MKTLKMNCMCTWRLTCKLYCIVACILHVGATYQISDMF